LKQTVEAATITDVVFVGAFTRYLVDTDTGDHLTVVRQNDGSSLAPGARVQLAWRAEDAYEITPQENQPLQEVK
jgi:hypothetical protein